MFIRFERIVIALMFALLFAGVTLVAVSAQDENPPQPLVDSSDCRTCHTEFEMSWENGAHGKSSSDPKFVAARQAQGSPTACLSCHVTGYDEASGQWKTEGVSCLACHTDSGGEHPKTNMTVNTEPTACGTCHVDTRFGWTEWQSSAHYQNGMDCANCHDPHSANLKLTGRGTKEPSQLCANCHKSVSEEAHGAHAANGVQCTDCHLTEMNVELPPHTVPDHSFKAALTQCTACHADQIHTAGTAALPEHPAQPAEKQEAGLLPENSSANPLGYALMAALVGIAAGMLLSPWLERGYKLALKKAAEVRHDDPK